MLIAVLFIVGCARKPVPPNFVFFLVDDLGCRDTGFTGSTYTGSTYYETPNIDGLAQRGIVFNAAYANAPNCAPTRASLMTGLYAPRHGIYTVGSSQRGESKHRKLIPVENTTVLDRQFVTIAEVFKQHGYETAHIFFTS